MPYPITSEVKIRLQQYGYNEITEKKVSPLAIFFIYFWGPIPWMIEVAAILSAIIHHWEDFLIISILLLVNAIVGFWQEHKADNADKSLKMSIVLQRFIPNISIISSNYSGIKGISWV